VQFSGIFEIEYRAKSAARKVRHPFFKGIREIDFRSWPPKNVRKIRTWTAAVLGSRRWITAGNTPTRCPKLSSSSTSRAARACTFLSCRTARWSTAKGLCLIRRTNDHPRTWATEGAGPATRLSTIASHQPSAGLSWTNTIWPTAISSQLRGKADVTGDTPRTIAPPPLLPSRPYLARRRSVLLPIWCHRGLAEF